MRRRQIFGKSKYHDGISESASYTSGKRCTRLKVALKMDGRTYIFYDELVLSFAIFDMNMINRSSMHRYRCEVFNLQVNVVKMHGKHNNLATPNLMKTEANCWLRPVPDDIQCCRKFCLLGS